MAPAYQSPVATSFSETQTIKLYLRIEIALAQAEAELGIIPVIAAKEIAARAKIKSLDLRDLRLQTERTGYPIAPLVRQLTAICGEHGQYLHWGATTQDILNTALAIQSNAALGCFRKSLLSAMHVLAELVRKHRATPMVARTFGGHALPITFGFKAAVWLSGLLRFYERLLSLSARPMPGEFAGVAGTLASFDGSGIAVRARLMTLLALPEPMITWASQRDCLVEVTNFLSSLCGALAKIAQDISDLSATEIGELAEPVSGGKDASSALPFKSNPIYCAQVMTSASIVHQNAALEILAMRQHNERSGEGFLETAVVPQIFIHTERCFEKLLTVLRGVQIFDGRMRDNLERTYGAILAERYMMALAPHIGRLRAHDLVHEACRQAVERRQNLADLLFEHPDVIRHIDRKTIAELRDPTSYLGNAQEMIDAVLAATPSEIYPSEISDVPRKS